MEIIGAPPTLATPVPPKSAEVSIKPCRDVVNTRDDHQKEAMIDDGCPNVTYSD